MSLPAYNFRQRYFFSKYKLLYTSGQLLEGKQNSPLKVASIEPVYTRRGCRSNIGRLKAHRELNHCKNSKKDVYLIQALGAANFEEWQIFKAKINKDYCLNLATLGYNVNIFKIYTNILQTKVT